MNFKDKQDNQDNLRRYTARLASLTGGKPLSAKLIDLNQIMGILAKEGEALLTEEEKKPIVSAPAAPKDETERLQDTLGVASKNPYQRARIITLKKLPEWKRKEILEMEKTGNTKNHFYEDFVQAVVALGDSFSSEK